ncbi:hypothetical protein [Tautonia marina]|uniref:hypothetical protein n=1 Tax=Tautonia marina TaxID=2653855 RepID=UPI0012605176|nr:hypothetical protein [Tautonia marina]
MSDRLIRQRWWVACLYCLAVVLAQGIHAPHGELPAVGGHTSAETCGDDHHENGNDQSSWDVAGVAPCVSDCPSCTFLLNHQALLADQTEVVRAAHGADLVCLTPALPRLSSALARNRAPPLA